jgi:hypothetical protein
VVVQIDGDGVADQIPFGIGGPPMVVIRIQPMAGELSKFVVISSDSSDEGEEDIIQTDRIPGRIVQTSEWRHVLKYLPLTSVLIASPTIWVIQIFYRKQLAPLHPYC